jgi:Flp pilus assembly protein TadB
MSPLALTGAGAWLIVVGLALLGGRIVGFPLRRARNSSAQAEFESRLDRMLSEGAAAASETDASTALEEPAPRRASAAHRVSRNDALLLALAVAMAAALLAALLAGSSRPRGR